MSHDGITHKTNLKGYINALFLRNDRLVPVGAVQPFAANVAPAGWLLCDGTQYDIEDYPHLYAVIGDTFGGTGGAFNVPDMRSKFPLGSGDGGVNLTNRVLADVGGAETHTLTVNEIPSHNHSITDPGHSHSVYQNTNDQSTDNAFSTETAADNFDILTNTGSSATGITINNTGGGLPHNNMPPFMVLNYIIKY